MSTSSFRSVRVSTLMFCLMSAGSAFAYGGGGSSGSSCTDPQFYEESPARNSEVPKLDSISLVASDNLDVASVELKVNGRPVTATPTRRRSGEWELKAALPEALTQAARVQIAIAAKSTDGCAGFFPWYVQVRP